MKNVPPPLVRSVDGRPPVASLTGYAIIVSLLAVVACGNPTTTPEVSPSPTATATATATAMASVAPAPTDPIGRAALSMDRAATWWLDEQPEVANHRCATTCHTTHPYLIARAMTPDGVRSETFRRVRAAMVKRIRGVDKWQEAEPMYGAHDGSDEQKQKAAESLGSEAVLNAASLLLAQRAVGQPADEETQLALSHMLSVQRDDGGWHWLDFGLQPFEAGNVDWGTALALLTIGSGSREFQSAPDTIVKAERARDLLLRRLQDTDKPMLMHAKVMVLWASSRYGALLDDETRAALHKDLLALRVDGAWSLSALMGHPTGTAGATGATDVPDAYATAYVTTALCASGGPRPVVREALSWLDGKQRDDGGWAGHSVNKRSNFNDKLMGHAATAYVIIAKNTCQSSAASSPAASSPAASSPAASSPAASSPAASPTPAP